jgi:drug/metabolite transporter (DMT)-like permease
MPPKSNAAVSGFDYGPIVLAVWFVTSIYFNYLTPEFSKYLNESLDITMVELISASVYAVFFLLVFGIPLLPTKELYVPMFKVGFCHLFACRLFVIAVAGNDKIPVSLAQTIRAANPVFVVMVSFLMSGKTYPLPVLLSLVPLISGFAMASLSEADFNAMGFAAAVGSVTTLVILSLISKDVYGSEIRPHWAQVQLWSCVVAAIIQAPEWTMGPGPSNVHAAINGVVVGGEKDDTSGFLKLVAINGAMYYAEQVMQFKAIDSYTSLTYSVIDTIRRLAIVCVTGFMLRGDSFNATKFVGVCIVCAGAIYYNISKEKAAAPPTPKARKAKKA